MRKIYKFLLSIQEKMLKLILFLCEYSNTSFFRSIITFVPICFLLVLFLAYSLPLFIIELIKRFIWSNTNESNENH